jgi:hypothetical protein
MNVCEGDGRIWSMGRVHPQPLDEESATSVQQKMLEHRASCELCKIEDLALMKGEVPTPTSTEVS